MKISYNFNELSNILEISFEIEGDDLTEFVNSDSLKIHFKKYTATYNLPVHFKREHLHNDCVALAALTLIYPFIGNRILFTFPISEDFASLLNSSGKRVLYRKEKIERREIPHGNGGINGINYNGSRESIAISYLLSNTKSDDVYIYQTEEELYNLIKFWKPDVRILGEDYISEGKDGKPMSFTGDDLPPKIIYTTRSHGWSTTKLKDLITRQTLKQNPKIIDDMEN